MWKQEKQPAPLPVVNSEQGNKNHPAAPKKERLHQNVCCSELAAGRCRPLTPAFERTADGLVFKNISLEGFLWNSGKPRSELEALVGWESGTDLQTHQLGSGDYWCVELTQQTNPMFRLIAGNCCYVTAIVLMAIFFFWQKTCWRARGHERGRQSRNRRLTQRRLEKPAGQRSRQPAREISGGVFVSS